MKKTIIAIALLSVLAFSSVASAEINGQEFKISEGAWLELAMQNKQAYERTDKAQNVTAEDIASWWNVFHDETMTNLIYTALRQNRTIEVARQKIEESRALLRGTKSTLLPWLDANGTWGKGRKPVETGGRSKGISKYSVGLDTSWEIDIFGGKHSKVKAVEESLQAEHAQLQDVWVKLSSEVALNYIALRTYQARLVVAKENLALQLDTHEMLQSKYDSGLIDALALSQERYVLEKTKASIPPIESAIEKLKNSIAVLTGEIPGSLESALRDERPIPVADNLMFVGIPAETIRKRPDIRVAEKRLAAQMSLRKSAEKDIYPKFYLFGTIGTESLSSGSLFDGVAKAYSLGPKITLPIFHWGAIKKNIKVQTAKEKQAYSVYEQTVLQAVAEVRNALTENIEERKRNESLANAVEAARVALMTANDKYRNGLVDFNNIIGAQQALLSLTDDYIASNGAISQNVVKVFRSIGGGWKPLS